MRRAWVVVVVCCACKRDAPAPPLAVAPPSASVPAVAAPTASSAPVDSTRALRDVASRWTDALNAHDDAALAALHAPTVKFYGALVDNATYVKKVHAALAKSPAFHQTLVFTNVEWRSHASAKISFLKHDGTRDTPAYLVLEQLGGKWLVVEESDVAADALAVKCLAYGQTVTLSGTVEDTDYVVADRIWPAQLLHLDHPICTLAGEDKEHDPHVDAIETLHLREGPHLPAGRQTVAGWLHHQDSPYYATEVALAVDDVDACGLDSDCVDTSLGTDCCVHCGHAAMTKKALAALQAACTAKHPTCPEINCPYRPATPKCAAARCVLVY